MPGFSETVETDGAGLPSSLATLDDASTSATIQPEVVSAFQSRFADWVDKFPFLNGTVLTPPLIQQAQTALDPTRSPVAGASIIIPTGRTKLLNKPSPGILLGCMVAFSSSDPGSGSRQENHAVLPPLQGLITALGCSDPRSQMFACAILRRGNYGVTEQTRDPLKEALASAEHIPELVKTEVCAHFRL
jgi:hypothetical protein